MRDEYGQSSEEEVEDGDDAEDDVPEPEDEVDLGVDDVLCEDTDPVVRLTFPRGPDHRDTAGHLGGKQRTHRIPAVSHSLTVT